MVLYRCKEVTVMNIDIINTDIEEMDPEMGVDPGLLTKLVNLIQELIAKLREMFIKPIG